MLSPGKALGWSIWNCATTFADNSRLASRRALVAESSLPRGRPDPGLAPPRPLMRGI